MIDEYITITGQVEAEIKVKSSRFIAFASPTDTPDDAQSILESVSKKYYDATHHCYAYQTGTGNDERFRYSDDGEPSGTAGKPIYQVIRGHQLTNVIIVVTRYYGGTKLGTGGLVRAYSDSASEALALAERKTQIISAPLIIGFPYNETSAVMRLIHAFNGQVSHSEYDTLTTLTVDLRLSVIEQFKNDLINITRGQALIRDHES